MPMQAMPQGLRLFAVAGQVCLAGVKPCLCLREDACTLLGSFFRDRSIRQRKKGFQMLVLSPARSTRKARSKEFRTVRASTASLVSEQDNFSEKDGCLDM